MRHFGIPQQTDLKAKDNATLVPVTTGTVDCTFKVEANRAIVNGKFVLVHSFGGCLQTVFDQAAAGGSIVNGDDLPRIIDSINVQSPVLGNTHDRKSYSGQVMAHIWEWIAQGYVAQRMRSQISAADGDTVINHYFLIPFTSELFEAPQHCCPWLGWLANTEVQFFLAASTVVATLSTGAVIKSLTNVRMWANTFVSSECYIPTIMQNKIYESTANGGPTAVVDGLGTSGSWTGVKAGSRLGVLYELTDQKGMGAAAGAANITSVKIQDLGIDTVNVDAFHENMRIVHGGHRGPVSGLGAVIVPDGAGNPESMNTGAGTDLTLNTATAMYTAYKMLGRAARLTKMPKVRGPMGIDRTFVTPPVTGRHRFAVTEFREFQEAKKDDLQEMAGFTRGAANRRYVTLTGKPLRDGQSDCLPQRLIR